MKKPLLLAVVFLIASAAAFADITFCSQAWGGRDTNQCNQNNARCVPPPATGSTDLHDED